jgi:hypothetical protein
MELGDRLRGLGLERYEPAFRENEINEKVLSDGRGLEGPWRRYRRTPPYAARRH